MRCIKTAAKHAVPIIRERMVIIDAAEETGNKPNLPVSMIEIPIMKDYKLTT
jgi:hypothetical protein